jgi:hypothetical protein
MYLKFVGPRAHGEERVHVHAYSTILQYSRHRPAISPSFIPFLVSSVVLSNIQLWRSACQKHEHSTPQLLSSMFQRAENRAHGIQHRV